MQLWPDIFSRFNNLKVLIIGDVMVDSYIWGVVERISPEAPVPIINVVKRDFRLGGAANVALNIMALGAEPILCSLIGKDDSGKKLLHLLDEKGMSVKGIVSSSHRPTTVKARVIAAQQHVVRIDEESDTLATSQEEDELLTRIKSLLSDCHVVIFEDYDKGVITHRIIMEVVKMSREKGIPTVVDPKKRNFLHYQNVTLFKPNLKELKEGLKIDIDAKNQSSVNHAVDLVKKRLNVNGVMLTLSEHGVFIDYQDKTLKIPAHKRAIADVSGAGDTVISIAALCIALNLSPDNVAGLSNLGGGLVCQHVGVVPIDREELLKEATAKIRD